MLHIRHTWLRNSFRTFAEVKLRPGAYGTEVRVTLRSSYFTAAFTTFWLAFGVIALVLVARTITGSEQIGDVGFSLAFVALGFAPVPIGRVLARPDAGVLLEFVSQTTGAKELPPELRPLC